MDHENGGGRNPGPYVPGGGRRPRRSLTFLLAVLCLALVALAFYQAIDLAPMLFGPRYASPGAENEVDLSARRVRVFVTKSDPAAWLKTLTDLPRADRREAEQLDRALFPGGPRHRYLLLVLTCGGRKPAVLSPEDLDLTLIGRKGKTFHPVDLAPVVKDREAAIEPWLATWLRLRVPPSRSLTVKAGGCRQILLAFPESAAFESLEGARLGKRRLVAKTMTKDALDSSLVQMEDPAGGS